MPVDVITSIGTRYEMKTEGKILFLEDLGEPAYRLDRMLTHLELAGKLERSPACCWAASPTANLRPGAP